MEITRLRLADLKPYANNVKLHPKEQIEQIKQSIMEFGNNDPIAVDENYVIIEGHGRYQALTEMGEEYAECIILEGMTEDQKNAYRLVHNKLTMNSGFDLEGLERELEAIKIDLDKYQLDLPTLEADAEDEEYQRMKADFEARMEAGELSEDDEEYQEFLEKFKPKKTTDDCYTPEIIYDALSDYVSKQYKVGKDRFVRPFVPGGDYQAYKYGKDDVVVDNPPFSILAQIVEFYVGKGIRFFLFAPGLTPFSASVRGALSICCGVNITYENGANVCTSFVTNLEGGVIKSCPELYQVIKKANEDNLKETKRTFPKYSYPLSVVKASDVNLFSKYGVEFAVAEDECRLIRELDAQKESGKGIFGSGYLISERKTKEREKAEREKAEREKAERWELSEREKKIIRELK